MMSEIVSLLLPKSWVAEQEVWGSIPGLTVTISEIGYLLLPCRDLAEIPLKQRKSLKPTNQPTCFQVAVLLE